MIQPTVAVTGATGFVGSTVVRTLLDRGHAVVALGRNASGADGPIRHVAAGDLNAPDYGAALPAGVDVVIHCAARVHVMDDRDPDPLAAFRCANVDATLSLARHAARRGVGRFIYLSSIKVNGEATAPGRPFCDDDAPSPADPYGVSKQEAEAGLREIAAATGLAITIIRPPLVYGPGVKGNFAALARLVRSGVPLPLGGITGNRRSLIAVGNLADLAVHCVAHPAAANRTFLASDGDDLSTTVLLRGMAAALGRPARLLPVPPAALRLLARAAGRPGIAERLCGSLQVDSAPARQLLDWTPPLSVAAGLAAAFAADRRA